MDCAMLAAAPVLPVGYVVSASWIADRRKTSRMTCFGGRKRLHPNCMKFRCVTDKFVHYT